MLIRHSSCFCSGLGNKRAQLAHFVVLSLRERKPVPLAQSDQAQVIIQRLLGDADLECRVPKRVLYQSGLILRNDPRVKTAPDGDCLHSFRDITLPDAFCLGLFFGLDLLFLRQNGLWINSDHHVCLVVKIIANVLDTISDYGCLLFSGLLFLLIQIRY